MKEILIAPVSIFIIIFLLFVICACMIVKEYDDNDRR